MTAYLIEKGARINHQENSGYTPLLISILEGNLKTSQVLIDLGADLTITSSEGVSGKNSQTYYPQFPSFFSSFCVIPQKSPYFPQILFTKLTNFEALHAAAQKGNVEFAKLLIGLGMNINQTTSLGFTPLHIAIYEGHTDLALALLEAGAQLNHTTKETGDTVLHLAVGIGNAKVTEALIKKKADLNALNADKQTPLDMAVQYKRNKCGELLQKAAALNGKSVVTPENPNRVLYGVPFMNDALFEPKFTKKPKPRY
jgi:ankyrin repeat protein